MSESVQIEVLDQAQRPANRPETRAIQGGALVTTPQRRIRLSKLGHVADELARVYRGMRSGDIRPEDGSRFAFVLQTLAKVIEASDFERRLEVLEGNGANREDE